MRSQSFVVALVALSTGAFAAPLENRAVEVGKAYEPRAAPAPATTPAPAAGAGGPAGGLTSLLSGLGLPDAVTGQVGDALVGAQGQAGDALAGVTGAAGGAAGAGGLGDLLGGAGGLGALLGGGAAAGPKTPQ